MTEYNVVKISDLDPLNSGVTGSDVLVVNDVSENPVKTKTVTINQVAAALSSASLGATGSTGPTGPTGATGVGVTGPSAPFPITGPQRFLPESGLKSVLNGSNNFDDFKAGMLDLLQ